MGVGGGKRWKPTHQSHDSGEIRKNGFYPEISFLGCSLKVRKKTCRSKSANIIYMGEGGGGGGG